MKLDQKCILGTLTGSEIRFGYLKLPAVNQTPSQQVTYIQIQIQVSPSDTTIPTYSGYLLRGYLLSFCSNRTEEMHGGGGKKCLYSVGLMFDYGHTRMPYPIHVLYPASCPGPTSWPCLLIVQMHLKRKWKSTKQKQKHIDQRRKTGSGRSHWPVDWPHKILVLCT